MVNMILLWSAVLLLHQGYALMSVTTVRLGEPVTLSCSFPAVEFSNTRIKWYKQSFGDSLALICTLMTATAFPTFGQGFLPSRFHTYHNLTSSTLTILRTIKEDEAVYHCTVNSWSQDWWNGIYLSLKENTQSTSDYTVVQWPTVSGPVHPGDSVSLQCSVLPDSEKKTCPDDYSVHWFGVRSDKYLPNVIYANGSRPDECDNKPDAHSPKSCVYHFSKNVSSSDAGTYYCAVATCGKILFGNGTKLEIKGTDLWSLGVHNMILLQLCVVFVINVIVIAYLIYTMKSNKCDYCNDVVYLQENVARRNLKRNMETGIYSAVVFTMMKTGSGGTSDAKAVDREGIYTAIKAFGLD